MSESSRDDPTLSTERVRAAAALQPWLGTQPAPDPQQIGPYRILERVGQGGMGIVYKAEQREPIRRLVALKLVRWGMDSAEVLGRFHTERQALALMEHPNVAKVLDAGTTETGRPYFVMEFVAGEPITVFCDRHNYTTHQRLELFTQACDAVQHAHQKAIIHRDIKPTNILVTLQGDQPIVKVIDFGVAKAISHKLTERTLFTEAGQLIGTPEYMSPEQAEMSALDIDTRSDIYSLGVVLYELLTGALPFDPKTLRSGALSEIQRIIREVEPPRPSTKLKGLGEGGTEIARRRQTHLHDLSRQLRRELEWIPLKAMRKDRARRYTTAAELRADIGNYLQQLPLLAGPESTVYRARKLLLRNKGLVAALTAIALAVLVGAIISTTLAIRLKRTADEVRQKASIAVAVNNFLGEMLSATDPERMLGDKVTVLEATNQALRRLDAGSLKDQPHVEVAVRNTIGNTLASLSRYDDAERVLRRALELGRSNLPAEHSDIARSMNDLGGVLQSKGEWAESEAILSEALQMRRRSLPAGHPDIAGNLTNLGSVVQHQGDLARAEALFREALQINRAALPADHPDLAASINNLSMLLQTKGDLAGAEPLLREAMDIDRRILPPGHPTISALMNNLATMLRQQGKFDQAEALCREAVALRRSVLPPAHPDIATGLQNLAILMREQGKLAEAEPLFREALEIYRKAYPAGHVQIAFTTQNLVKALLDQDKLAEAEPLARQALATQREQLPPGHPMLAASLHDMAMVRRQQGKPAEAEELSREALAISRAALPPTHPEIALGMNNLAILLEEQGKRSEALPLYREVLQLHRQTMAPDHPQIAAAMNNLGAALQSNGDLAEAELIFREALRIRRKTLAPDHPALAYSLHNLGTLLLEEKKFTEAERVYREALEIRRAKFGAAAGPTTRTANALAVALLRLDRKGEADALRAQYNLPVATRPTTR